MRSLMTCLCLGLGLAAIAASAEPGSVPDEQALPESSRGAYEYPSEIPEVLHRPVPAYPESAWIAGIEGRALILVRIDTTGAVAEARFDHGPSVFRDAALEAVRKWTYSPARDQDRTITVWTRIPIMFRLDEFVPPGDSSVASLAERPPTRRTTFECRQEDTNSNPPRRDVAQALVDARGRVRSVRFARPAPPDSMALRASILAWAFTPVPTGATGTVDRTSDSWIRIPIVRTCP